MTPSSHQTRIYDFIASDAGSASINAVAGSGKTTTLVEGLKHLPSFSTPLLLAFNKSIATELQSRIPPLARASTFHSLLFSTFPKGTKVFGGKVAVLAKKIIPQDDHEIYLPYVKMMVGKLKSIPQIPTEQDISHLEDLFDLSVDGSQSTAWHYVLKVYKASLEQTNEIDFDDMLLHPIIYDRQLPSNNHVFVDESQDLNSIQHEILRRVCADRLFVVGDPYQAIYGFRGALHDSMSTLARYFHSTHLPLSVSYRCPRAIVAAAQEFCPTIQSWDGAIDGEVVDKGNEWTFDDLPSGSAVLCRLNRPLVRLAWQLIREKRPCYILGRDIADGFISLVNKMKQSTIGGLLRSLEQYQEVEEEKFELLDQKGKAAALADRLDSIRTLAEGFSVSDHPNLLTALIDDLFTAKPNSITLSTIHKAKGLEWNNVFILGRWNYMPFKLAKQAWELQQENNLIYVAYTRAKQQLVFIEEK